MAFETLPLVRPFSLQPWRLSFTLFLSESHTLHPSFKPQLSSGVAASYSLSPCLSLPTHSSIDGHPVALYSFSSACHGIASAFVDSYRDSLVLRTEFVLHFFPSVFIVINCICFILRIFSTTN